MGHASLMRYVMRALAITLVVVAHAFLLNLGHAATPALGFAYVACVIGLAVSAALLWRKTLD
jgi:Na+/melibiose symporter-like transporter